MQSESISNDQPTPSRHEPDWPFVTIALFGLWMLASPATYGYSGPIIWSDLIAGVFTLAAGIATLNRRHRWWARWVAAMAGFWLLFAPLIFAVPEAAAYLNCTVVGTLLIAMAIVIPRWFDGPQPLDPEVPPGWSYNPSSWLQRLAIIVLALINFLLARYLAAYQLGHIDAVWDPIFGEGTHNVLTSDISEAFPISDAGLGAVAYMLEALIGCIGNASRWRTAPWVVAVFGILVVPVGVVSIMLIMLQPLAVDDWCFICLLTAALMLLMALLAVPEVVALIWFMWRTKREGRPFWRTFFLGGPVDGGSMDHPPVTLTSPPRDVLRAMVAGATMPWTLVVAAIAGAWLLASPAVFGLDGSVANSHYIIGALSVTASVLAMAEPIRAARYLNVVFALAVAIAPFALAGATTASQVNSVVVALVLIGASIPRGPIRQQHGAWQRLIM